MDMPEASNVSIMVRIRRTVIEEIHVSVPVTSDMLDPLQTPPPGYPPGDAT